MTEQPDASLPDGIAHAWRMWLLTGSRRERIDPRRVRGAHLGLKRVLTADMLVRGEPPYGWREFSDAMLRQAIGDAVRTLDETDARMLKLAYFGGYSNREIALDAGLSEAAVATRLRRTLAAVADRIQRSSKAVRRAAYAVVAWFCGRACESSLQHALQASVVAVAAVVVVAAGPAPAAAPRSGVAPPPPVRAVVVRSDVTSAAEKDASAGPAANIPATPASAAPVVPVVPVPDAAATSLPVVQVTAPALPASPAPVTLPDVAVPKAPAVPAPPQLPLRA